MPQPMHHASTNLLAGGALQRARLATTNRCTLVGCCVSLRRLHGAGSEENHLQFLFAYRRCDAAPRCGKSKALL